MDKGEARRLVVEATRARQAAEPKWRRAILDALAAGVGASEVAMLAQVTRQRVWQIRDEECQTGLT